MVRKSLWFILVIVLLSGCQTNQQVLTKLLGLNDALSYQKIEQGYFQETLYRSEFYNAITLSFELLNQYPGDFSPATGIALQDASAQQFLHIKYIVLKEKPAILVELREGTKVTRSEQLEVELPVKEMYIAWENDQVSINVGSTSKQLTIPFEAKYIIHFASSVEILSKVKLHEKI